MKVTTEHYNYMFDAIASIPEQKMFSIRAAIKEQGNYRDLEKRFRWDLFAIAGLSQWACENIYPYANDDHLDTALRLIMKNLNIIFD